MDGKEDNAFLRYLQYLTGRTAVRLYTVQLGVWRVAIRKEPRSFVPSFPKIQDVKKFFRYFGPAWAFIKDVYRIAPRQFVVYVLHRSWSSIDGGLSIYVSGKLTEATLNFLQGHGEFSKTDIYYALLAQSALVITRQLINNLTFHDLQILKDRIKFHFTQKALHHELGNLENTTLNRTDEGSLGSSTLPHPFFSHSIPDAWYTFDTLSATLYSTINCISQIYFGFALVKQYNFDPLYTCITLAKPYFTFRALPDYFYSDHLIYCANQAYKRLLALQQLAFDSTYRTDIQSDGVGNFIIKEFSRCRNEVGDAHTDNVISQWPLQQPLYKSSLIELISTLSTNYFVLKAILQPGSLTLNSYTLLQQTSQSIAFTVFMLTEEIKVTASRFEAISMHYPELNLFQEDAWEGADPTENKLTETVSEGTTLSEATLSGHEVSSASPDHSLQGLRIGMQIEFRNVSFTYPGTEKKALNEVSFVIKPGQLVAIVGVNGSGKSTITNLVNRLYDPGSGEVLVDGIPIKQANLVDIRRSMTILRQNHNLYPLSLRENIALGLPDQEVSDEQIEEALRDGGAHGFVQKLPDKVDTNLRPVAIMEGSVYPIAEELGLKEEVWTNLSGGESQRLAAARAFLRLKGGGIRFLAADEPTSALDPEGEHDLFAKLRENHGEMTIVFITHRFGHVTKHADLILCMKDGSLVEQGTHEELLAKCGEYYKLHSVQAQAF